MKIRIGKETIKFSKTRNHFYWNSIEKLPEIEIENEWFKCIILFLKKENNYYAQISELMKFEEGRLKKYEIRGVYKEIKVSRFKMNIIKLLMKEHKINLIISNFRKTITERRNTIFIFAIAIILSVVYYLINSYQENYLMKFISENNFLQSCILFLTISSFINIFYPFTIKKQIENKDVEKITQDKLEEDKAKKENAKNATL